MDFTQNVKISQITENLLIVGIDVGCLTHYAHAFDWRGHEVSRVFKFTNCRNQFEQFLCWMRKIARENGKKKKDAERLCVGSRRTGSRCFFIIVAMFTSVLAFTLRLALAKYALASVLKAISGIPSILG